MSEVREHFDHPVKVIEKYGINVEESKRCDPSEVYTSQVGNPRHYAEPESPQPR